MIENCKNCGKKVEFGFFGNVYPGGKDREEAICPYCGNILESSMTSQSYYVRGLDDNDKVDQ